MCVLYDIFRLFKCWAGQATHGVYVFCYIQFNIILYYFRLFYSILYMRSSIYYIIYIYIYIITVYF